MHMEKLMLDDVWHSWSHEHFSQRVWSDLVVHFLDPPGNAHVHLVSPAASVSELSEALEEEPLEEESLVVGPREGSVPLAAASRERSTTLSKIIWSLD
jgi:hypothetical protein